MNLLLRVRQDHQRHRARLVQLVTHGGSPVSTRTSLDQFPDSRALAQLRLRHQSARKTLLNRMSPFLLPLMKCWVCPHHKYTQRNTRSRWLSHLPNLHLSLKIIPFHEQPPHLVTMISKMYQRRKRLLDTGTAPKLAPEPTWSPHIHDLSHKRVRPKPNLALLGLSVPRDQSPSTSLKSCRDNSLRLWARPLFRKILLKRRLTPLLKPLLRPCLICTESLTRMNCMTRGMRTSTIAMSMQPNPVRTLTGHVLRWKRHSALKLDLSAATSPA